jgi:hypothetical protein
MNILNNEGSINPVMLKKQLAIKYLSQGSLTPDNINIIDINNRSALDKAYEKIDMWHKEIDASKTIVIDKINQNQYIDVYMPISLPFKSVWVEWLRGELTITDDSGREVFVEGCLAISDNLKIHTVVILRGHNTFTGSDDFFIFTNTMSADQQGRQDESIDPATTASRLLRILLAHINKSHHGEVQVNQKFKTRSNGKNTRHEIKKIIYCSESKTKTEPLFNREVDWSHRWLVRGHWRKCSTIGKDQFGNYGINAFTWVKPHEKGPEHLQPVFDKTRVFKGAIHVQKR